MLKKKITNTKSHLARCEMAYKLPTSFVLSSIISTLLLKASFLGTDIKEAMIYVSAPLFICLGIICLALR